MKSREERRMEGKRVEEEKYFTIGYTYLDQISLTTTWMGLVWFELDWFGLVLIGLVLIGLD